MEAEIAGQDYDIRLNRWRCEGLKLQVQVAETRRRIDRLLRYSLRSPATPVRFHAQCGLARAKKCQCCAQKLVAPFIAVQLQNIRVSKSV
jgi:hypothetical protein